jgi:hypothetical protein
MANGRSGRTVRSRVAARVPAQRVNMGFEEALDNYEKVIKEKVLRSGAAAIAKTFYLEMRARVPVDKGTLFGSIYHWHDAKRSGFDRQVYMAGPNKRTAPHWAQIEYGHWLYNKNIDGKWQKSKSQPNARGPQAHDLPGALEIPVWVPAKPYIQPAWDVRETAFRNGLEAMKRRAKEEL